MTLNSAKIALSNLMTKNYNKLKKMIATCVTNNCKLLSISLQPSDIDHEFYPNKNYEK